MAARVCGGGCSQHRRPENKARTGDRGNLQTPTPGELLLPAWSHLLKVPQPPDLAPLAGG